MADRALIIAIWNYAGVQGLAPVSLDAVQPGADKFYQWLRQIRGIPASNIVICSDGLNCLQSHPPSVVIDGTTIPLIFGSTFAEINRAIANLVSFAPNRTEDFFVYYAGHGFSYKGNPNDQGVSFLLTSDFVSPAASGNACINLPYMQRSLSSALSGVHHFHFVDACRNELPPNSINPQGGFGVVFQASNNGSAPLFTLYSARQGDAADASADFADALADGLSGTGHAKQWVNGELWVTFNRVTLYMTASLNRKLASDAGDQDDRITPIPQPWNQNCRVLVRSDPTGGPYKLKVSQAGGLMQTFDVASVPYILPLPPSDNPYILTLTKGVQSFRMVEPSGRIDMYSACDVLFEPLHDTEPPAPPLQLSTLRINPDFLHVGGGVLPERKFSIDGLAVHSDLEAVRGITLLPGEHTVSLIEDGRSVWHRPIDLDLGGQLEISVGAHAPTTFQQDLLKTIGQEHYRTPDLSETLGPTADWDVNLWLSYLGVAQLRRRQGMYLKLSTIIQSLTDPPALRDGESGLMVMIMDDSGMPDFALHFGTELHWTTLNAVPGVSSLYAYVSVTKPGRAFVSLKRQQGDPFTYSTTFTSGEYTLITIATGMEVRVQQLSLPQTNHTTTANDNWAHPSLTDLQTARVLSYAQSAFQHRRPVWQAEFARPNLWTDLRDGIWHNEELATLCAFDCKRRGLQEDLRRFLDNYSTSAANAFARDLAVLRSGVTYEYPLLLDAYLLLRAEGRRAPFSVGHLDFRGLWVSWYGAVSAKKSIELGA